MSEDKEFINALTDKSKKAMGDALSKNKYTIEELKEKVVTQLTEKGVEFGTNKVTGGYIDDDFNIVLQSYHNAFKELITEKIKSLDRYYWDGVANRHVTDKEGAYLSIGDIEELFNIKLK